MLRFLLILSLLLIHVTNISAQTINIAALRIEFAPDNTPLTTGDGTFAVDSITTETFAVDPAPHNKRYFSDQLVAADNYFNNVTNGSVRITGTVFPAGENESYRLSNEMNYYNSNISSEETDRGLANLFVDAVNLANEDSTIDWGAYDLVVIFHAGVGRDVDLGFDQTPQDIPSLYITPDFMQKNYDPLFTHIAVGNGERISKCIILPETENQQGFQLALTGIFVANVGSFLGLYDLFSAAEQSSGIGRFGLMDAGLFNINGLVPAPPSAFSRVFKNWQEPTLLTQPSNGVRISRFKSLSSDSLPSIIEISLNEDESFLVEYRGNHLDNIDSILFEIFDERGEFPEYMEILQTYYPDRIEIDSVSGVLLSVDNYDLGMPGAGLLIWHIDKAAIRNASNNLINDNPLWRAVDLEEADGSQDIGQQYNILQAGYGSDLGTLLDYWYAGNYAPLYKNVFNGSSAPDTRSNLNLIESHINLSEFSNNKSEIMTFNFAREFYEDGFPVSLEQEIAQPILVNGAINNNGITEEFVFSLNQKGEIHAIGSSGNGLFQEDNFLFNQTSENLNGVQSFVLVDTNQIKDQIYDLLIALSNGTLYGFDLTSSDADSLDFETNAQITAAVSSPIIEQNNLIHFVDGDLIQSFWNNGVLAQTPLDLNSTFLFDLITDSSGSPFNPDQSYNFLAKDRDGQIIGALIENGSTQFSIIDPAANNLEHTFITDSITGQFSIADIDGNGTVDIVCNSAQRLMAFNKQGFTLLNFPLHPKLSAGEKLIGTPMIIDLNGNNDIALIITSNKGQIIAYNKHGDILNGFPIAAGGQFSQQAIPLQFDDDSPLELCAISDFGVVSAWEILGTGPSSKLIWSNTNLNASNNAHLQEEYLIQDFGNNIIQKKRFFNYPNPNIDNFTTIRYYLNDPAQVTIRIFDSSGYKVDEFNGPGFADADNEVEWNVKNISSGVYICQLDVRSENKRERELIKILVVH